MTTTSVIHRRLPVLGAVVLVALALAACGSSTNTKSSTGSSAATSGTAASSRTKLVACLKQHGVTLPSGGFRRRSNSGTGSFGGSGAGAPGGGPGAGGGYGGGGLFGSGSGSGAGAAGSGAGPGARGGFFANPKLRAAFKACGGATGFRRPTGATAAQFKARREAAVAKFSACVKQHGYTLPKANFSGSGPIFPASIEKNRKFQTAAKACASDLQTARPGAGAGAPPTGSTSTSGANS